MPVYALTYEQKQNGNQLFFGTSRDKPAILHSPLVTIYCNWMWTIIYQNKKKKKEESNVLSLSLDGVYMFKQMSGQFEMQVYL